MNPQRRSTRGSIPAMLTLLTLTVSAASVKTHPRHDGKSHDVVHDTAEARLHPRSLPEANGLGLRQPLPLPLSLMQDPPLSAAPAGNGPVGGISNIIAPPLPPVSSASALSPSVNAASPVAASPTLTPSGNPILPSDLPTSVSDGFPNPFPSATSYYFPSTTIQIPIATVCPDTPLNSAVFSILPYNSLNSTSSATGYLPPRPVTTSVTAFLPKGSSTVFLTTTRLSTSVPAVPLPSVMNATSPSPPAGSVPDAPLPSGALPLEAQDRVPGGEPTARILLDADGCQTLYSPVTTALCRTTVRLIGIPDATITDCDQWVTFSSDAPGCISSAPADNTPLPFPNAALTARDASANAINASPAPASSPTVSDGLPGTYYEAHWYDLVHRGVPRAIRAESCSAVSGPYSGQWVSCQTESQRWSVSTETKTTSVISVASYRGPAILTVGTLTITTTLSFETTLTLPTTTLSPTVIKETLSTPLAGGDGAEQTATQGTVTAMATAPHTIQLNELTRTSEMWTTETQYETGVETVTRTMGS